MTEPGKDLGQKMTYEQKTERLGEIMDQLTQKDLCLAFSGGVDSSLLLKMAADLASKKGTRVWAVTFDSRLHPSCDLENARKTAGELGGIHVILKVDELEMEEIRHNPVNRCYLCKRHLFLNLKKFAQEKGAAALVEGTNEDDLHVYRPGIKAVMELGVRSPLAEAGLTKEQVRRLAEGYGISTAHRPSTPCMATRLPYGALLDYDVLKKIEAGEEILKRRIGGNVRLRLHGSVARIEADLKYFPEVVKQARELSEELKELGFVYITLDLEGFRSGSMDVGLGKN